MNRKKVDSVLKGMLRLVLQLVGLVQSQDQM